MMLKIIVLITFCFSGSIFAQADSSKTPKQKKIPKAAAAMAESGKLAKLQSKADYEFDMGFLDSALASYLAIKTQKPGFPKNDLKIGKIYFAKKDYANAEKLLSASAAGDEDGLRKLAQCYQNLRQGPKAIEAYQRLLKITPEDKALAKTIYLLCEENNAGSAPLLGAYKDYLALAPEDKLIALKAAYLQEKSDNPAVHETGLLKILEVRPMDIPIRIELGALYLSKQQNDKALAVLEGTESLEPGNVELLRLIATVYGNVGKKKAMAGIMEKMIPLEKQSEVALEFHKQLGALYVEWKDPKSALSHYEIYIKAHPADVSIQRALLLLYREAQNKEKEKEALSALIKLEPVNIRNRQDRGDMQYSAGSTDSALADYLAIKDIEPRNTKNDLRIGKIHYGKKEYTKAEKCLSASAGQDEEALRMLADCYLNLKQGSKAIEMLQRVFKIKATDAAVAKKICALSEEMIVGNASLLKAYEAYLALVPGDSVIKAKTALTQNIMANPKDTASFQSRGDLFFAAKDSVSALRDYLSVFRLDPKIMVNDMRIAAISYASRNFERAVEFLLRSAGTNREAWMMLADCYEQLGQKQKAIETYRTLLALDPANTEIKARLDRLEGQK